MSWTDLAFLSWAVVGVVLFLYGANNYDAPTGWTGLALLVASFFGYIAVKAYEASKKKENR